MKNIFLKKVLLLLFLTINSVILFGQTTVTFWTDSKTAGGGYIEIYVNDSYEGRITSYYGNGTPSCGASGCVTVNITHSNNTWYARGENGDEWKGHFTLEEGCNLIRINDNGNSGSGYSGGTSPNSGNSEALATAAAAIAIAAVAVVAFAASNDIYFNKTESSMYNGYNFGLKNRLNSHIDLEYGTSINKAGFGLVNLSPLKSNYIGMADKTLWTLDFNAVYNFRTRENWENETMFNPYFGFGTSTFLNDYKRNRFGFGGIVGFSIGRRLKLHCRYKWLNNFQHNVVLMNQFEVGLSIRYQNKWFFKK